MLRPTACSTPRSGRAGLDPHPSGLTVRSGINDAVLRPLVGAGAGTRRKRIDTDRALSRFEDRVRRFGYSLSEPRRLDVPAEPAMARSLAASASGV